MSDTAEPRVLTPRILHQSAGAVVIDGDQCLIMRRGSEWIFPKGHLEAGERPVDAAVREVREETSIEIEIDGYVGSTRYEFGSLPGPVMSKRVDWYWGHPTTGSLQTEATFDEASFVQREEALARLTHDSDREIAVQAFALAGGGSPVDTETIAD